MALRSARTVSPTSSRPGAAMGIAPRPPSRGAMPSQRRADTVPADGTSQGFYPAPARTSTPGFRAPVPRFVGAQLGHTKAKRRGDHPRLFSGGAGNRTRVRKASSPSSFTCVVVVSPTTGSADSAATYPSLILATLSRAPSRGPALVVHTRRVPGRSSPWMAQRFLGRESKRVVVRN
jgi:hypothetical protein